MATLYTETFDLGSYQTLVSFPETTTPDIGVDAATVSNVTIGVWCGNGGSVTLGCKLKKDDETYTSNVEVENDTWDGNDNAIYSFDFSDVAVYVDENQQMELVVEVVTSDFASNPRWEYGPNSALYLVVTGDEVATGKATNPTPANGAGPGYDFSTPTLSWTNNGGEGATFNVYGGGAGTFVLLVEGLEDPTVTLDSTDQAAMQCGSGASCTWRVDTIVGSTTYTGDVWTFDPRPSAPTNPTPANAASDVNFAGTEFSWDASTGDVDTYDVVVNGNTLSAAQAGTSYTLDTDAFDWDDSVTWKIDATNYFGTTSSSEWDFDVIDRHIIQVSYELIDGGSGLGPYDGGVEGVDWWWTGLNGVITVKRLVVAASDRIYYETL